MSGPPVRLPPPPNRELVPVLAAITFIALVIAAWGFLSLLLNRDAIDYDDAGPLLGPAMVVVAAIVTWLVLRQLRKTNRPGVWVLVALAGSFTAMVVVGGVGIAVTRGQVAWLIPAEGHFVLSPFTWAAAVLSALTVLVVALAGRSSHRRAG